MPAFHRVTCAAPLGHAYAAGLPLLRQVRGPTRSPRRPGNQACGFALAPLGAATVLGSGRDFGSTPCSGAVPMTRSWTFLPVLLLRASLAAHADTPAPI